MSETMTKALGNIKQANGFNAWMFEQYDPFINWGRVWDIGSGLGGMSSFLLKSKFLCLSDYEEHYHQALKATYHDQPHVVVEPVDLSHLDIAKFRAYNFDTIISTNVLEHIKDDHHAMGSITQVMNKTTTLITLVPAHPFLYGEIDRAVNHYRRYTLLGLKHLLEASGQKVVSIKYFSRVSALGWLIKSRFLKQKDINELDMKMVEYLLPILKLEKFLPLPFGQSLIAVSNLR